VVEEVEEGSGEWGVGSGEWGVGSGEWGGRGRIGGELKVRMWFWTGVREGI